MFELVYYRRQIVSICNGQSPYCEFKSNGHHFSCYHFSIGTIIIITRHQPKKLKEFFRGKKRKEDSLHWPKHLVFLYQVKYHFLKSKVTCMLPKIKYNLVLYGLHKLVRTIQNQKWSKNMYGNVRIINNHFYSFQMRCTWS